MHLRTRSSINILVVGSELLSQVGALDLDLGPQPLPGDSLVITMDLSGASWALKDNVGYHCSLHWVLGTVFHPWASRGKATAPGKGQAWESHFESGSQSTVDAGKVRSIAFICPHQGKKSGQGARLLLQGRDKGPHRLIVEMET